jgi:HAE1 family hydrophobic/amphiphilic exporter-1
LKSFLPWLATSRPVTVVTAFLVVAVVGVIAWIRIPLQMMPSGFDPPFLWIYIPWDDATPAEVDARIVTPVAEQLATVAGVQRMGSEAKSDNAEFDLEFRPSMDMDEAYNAVTDRLERARASLPTDVERTFIWRFDPTDEPVIWAGISSPPDTPNLYELVTRIVQKRLERIPGVGRVDIWGADEPIVWVEFDRDALLSSRVDLVQLMGRLGADNLQVASGVVEDRGAIRYVRGLSRFGSLEDLRRFPVREGVKLSDVASVELKAIPSADITRIDGQEGAGLAINKESSANAVEVCADVNAALEELARDPRLAGFHFPVFFDQGKLIGKSMHALERAAVEGGILAILVLFVFLREWRITTLITATIPIALLFTIGWMYFAGDSLNLLSMLGLMLAVGMVLDNAVVVVESIYRHRQAGEGAVEAAVKGTSRVFIAVTLSAITACVVFLPIMLMSGDAGFSFFMRALGMPVVIVHVGAWLASLLFTPLSTVWLSARHVREDPAWLRWLAGKVDAGVQRVLTHPLDTFVGILAVLVVTAWLPMKDFGCSDEGNSNLNDFGIRFTVPAAFTYEERLDTVKTFERLVQANHTRWGVRAYRARLGSSNRTGHVNVSLADDAEGALPREEVMKDARKRLPDLPGVESHIGWSGGGASDAPEARVNLFGEDPEALQTLAEEALRRARVLPGVLGAHTDVEAAGNEEMRLNVNRDAAARYGVSAAMVGRLVSFAMRGAPLPSWHDGNRELRVYTRFGLEDRASVDQLLDFEISSPTTHGAVALRSLVDAGVSRAWGTINRENGRTSIGIIAELEPEVDRWKAGEALQASLSAMSWPRGYGVERGGDFEREQESDDAKGMAFLLSIVFVFLIMGIVMESFLLPLTIITTVPMAMLGVVWGLWMTDTPFDAMGAIGMIILIGIVVNNGIVLIDVVQHLRDEGVERTRALREAVQMRLRPILMTALTAVVGVLPMALGSETFIGIPYAPLGRVIVFGMIVATGLTLFYVPYLYTVLDDLRAAGGRWLAFAWPGGRRSSAAGR